MKMNRFQAPKKQTQFKPNSPALCPLPSVFCLLSMAPIIAIVFDYNGIFITRLSISRPF